MTSNARAASVETSASDTKAPIDVPCRYDVAELPLEDARHYSVKRSERMRAQTNRLLGADLEQAEAACENPNAAGREACITEQLEQKQDQAIKRASASFDTLGDFYEKMQACDALKDQTAAKQCHDALESEAARYVEEMRAVERRQRDARLTREWLRIREDEGCLDAPKERCGTCATVAALAAEETEPLPSSGRFLGPGVVRSLQGHRTLELVFVEIRPADAGEQLCASFVTADDEGEADAIRRAVRGLLAGKLPRENAAYVFARTHPFEPEDCFGLERLDNGQLEARKGDWLVATSGGRTGFRARFWGEQQALLLADLTAL